MKTPADIAAAHLTTCRVTYRMSDQMGVVYYGNYFELFEIGRTELLRTAGFSYARMESDGFLLPVHHAAADYLAPARYDDLLEILTTISRLDRLRIDFTYQIRRQGESQALCRGTTRHVVTGPDGRPRRLSAQWQQRLLGLAGHPAGE